MSFGYSNVLTVIGISFTVIVGVGWVLPRLSVPARLYYAFLLCWTVPYVFGQICQEDEWGHIWVQYYLVDFSYIQSSTAFGGALYVLIRKIRRAQITETGIHLSMIALLVISVAVSYTGEVWDTCWALVATGSMACAVDWLDYLSFTAGLGIAAIPCILYPRVLAGIQMELD